MIQEDNNLHEADGNKNEENTPQNPQESEVIEGIGEVDNIDSHDPHENEIPEKNYESLSVESLVSELEQLISDFSVHRISKYVNAIKQEFYKKIDELKKEKKDEYLADGGEESSFHFENPFIQKFNQAFNEYKKQIKAFYQNVEEQQNKNLEKRKELIEELKKLYTEPQDSNSELFREFRRIKKEWHDAGKIPHNYVSDIFRTYYHHLDNFYEYLNLNKELQELDYAHNLDTRHSIIQRAENLINEPNLQKALNELQYLHKLWKEEAVPVAEEFRESTWNQFKEITHKIHDKKQEYFEERKKEEEENKTLKEKIIAQLNEINNHLENNHKFFQTTLKKVETLRKDFMEAGRAPKSHNNQLWNDFKDTLRVFNQAKNSFYREMKNNQNDNLERKQELVKISKENIEREDWQEAVQLYKKIQSEWKNIGVIPRKFSQQLWTEFNENCNAFFERYKKRNQLSEETLSSNLKEKEEVLNELKNTDFALFTEEQIAEKVSEINKKWNNVGQISKADEGLYNEFRTTMDAKLKEAHPNINLSNLRNQIKANKIKQSGDQNKQNEELRRIKTQIQDTQSELTQLENNFSFFSNADDNNPLLKNAHKQIEEKKQRLNNLQEEYNSIRNIKFSKSNPAEE